MSATDENPGEKVILSSLETPTLTKAELSELLFEQIGLNKRESKDMIDAFFDLLDDSVGLSLEVRAVSDALVRAMENDEVRQTNP